MLSAILALLAFLGWGVGDGLGIMLYRRNNPATVTVANGLARILIWLLLLPMFIGTVSNISLTPLLFNLLAGFASGLGYYFFGKASKLTNPALVASISGGWSASALVIALAALGETLTGNQWLAVLTVFAGLFLLAVNPDWLKQKRLLNNRGVVYALLTLLSWGVCGAFLKIPAVAYGWYWTSLIMLFPYLLVLFAESRSFRLEDFRQIAGKKLFLTIVLFTILGDLGYNAGFAAGGNVTVIGTIAGSYATLSTYLAHKLYKEPLTRRQKIGILISLAGIVLTAYFSSLI